MHTQTDFNAMIAPAHLLRLLQKMPVTNTVKAIPLNDVRALCLKHHPANTATKAAVKLTCKSIH